MENVSEYIASQPEEVRDKLNQLRDLLNSICPGTETIKYNMPAYKAGKNFLYFSAAKKHIGMYPGYNFPEIEDELCVYRGKGTKNSLHFSLQKPLPIELIRKYILLSALK